MSLQAYFDMISLCHWAHFDPMVCGCRGGWLLSDLDTWHRCPVHGAGVPHPEDDITDFDYDAHAMACLRAAYREYRVRSEMDATSFNGCVALILRKRGIIEPEPSDWVAAARYVSDDERAYRETCPYEH